MSTELIELRTYVAANDGITGLASLLGVTKGVVWAWIDRGRAPIERCYEIERATGGAVRRWHLRPDDWYRIWPELIGADGAPAVPTPEPTERAA